MVLKGSLREFILADIFNLLTQQKITGKLILSSGEEEGIIAFRDGYVAGAVKGEEQLQKKLFSLLVHDFRFSREEIVGLFASYDNNLSGLFHEIVHLKLVGKELLESYAVSVVEDIACSFFLWTKGTYYFSSVPFIEDMAPHCVSISIENLAMEAMRRVDEWNRMQKFITKDMVFVPNERRAPEVPAQLDPLEQTLEYVYEKIDGISPVAALFRSTSLTEYKVYEALQELINENRITPLSTRISQSVVAALEKKELETRKVYRPLTTLAAAVTGLAMILVIVFIGTMLLHRLILLDFNINARLAALELPLGETMQKVAVASLLYRATHGTITTSIEELAKASLLLESDIRPLYKMKSIKELPTSAKNYILYPNAILRK
ncbi:MAG: DUF4388 domain-containing protein [Chitinispirillaceae bacterium]|nr:DUF4388 domain-containing protein [Chitinispirillaceae bacterium]